MTDARKLRWTISMHEAGHAVVFLSVWPRCGRMEAIARDSGGFTTAPTGIRPAPFAIGVAAGKYAEKLARRYPVPGDPPPAPTPETGATAEEIRADAVAEAAVKTNPTKPDPELIAHVCIRYAPADPADWVERHAYFHNEAKKLVKQHADEIHRVAVQLYRHGRWYREGDPITNLQFSGAFAGE